MYKGIPSSFYHFLARKLPWFLHKMIEFHRKIEDIFRKSENSKCTSSCCPWHFASVCAAILKGLNLKLILRISSHFRCIHGGAGHYNQPNSNTLLKWTFAQCMEIEEMWSWRGFDKKCHRILAKIWLALLPLKLENWNPTYTLELVATIATAMMTVTTTMNIAMMNIWNGICIRLGIHQYDCFFTLFIKWMSSFSRRLTLSLDTKFFAFRNL